MDDKELTIVRWFLKADHDLYTAKTMAATEEIPTEVVCFHSQQAAEKALKGRDIPEPEASEAVRLAERCVTAVRASLPPGPWNG